MYTCFAATALGAKIIEKHVILDKKTPGPDQSVSIDFMDLKSLVDGIRKIELSLGDDKSVHSKEKQIREWAFRSIVTTAKIKAGDVFSEENLWTKRPGTGIPSAKLPEILGKIAKNDIEINTLLRRGHLLMRILFVTGSRGEWGYIRPILRLIEKDPELEYELCVTNMHLLPNFGLSEEEIKNDGFEIKHRVFMSLDSYNHISQVKSLGIFLTSMADILASNDYDFIMLAGDRGEQLMGAIAGAYTYIPVGHIQAGEVSGNIDGAARHAIGKLAHVHFASNEDAEERLIKLAEEKFRVFNTGAPQVDEMVQTPLLDPEYFEKKYNFDITKEFFLSCSTSSH